MDPLHRRGRHSAVPGVVDAPALRPLTYSLP